MTTYTDKQVSDFFQELKRQAETAGTAPRLCGLFWRPLEAIAGPRAFEVFELLRARGLLTSETIPNTYGHQVHTLAG